MTSLPQTTLVRSNRTNGQGQMILPGMMPPGSIANPPSFQMNGADVWRVIRSNIWLILAMLVVASVAGYVINRYLAKYYSSYTAEGSMRVEPPAEIDLFNSKPAKLDNASLAIEQRTHVQLIGHESRLSTILRENQEMRETGWYQQFTDPILRKEDLIDNLSVRPIPDSKLIEVSMSCSKPKDAKKIVEIVIQTHLDAEQKSVRFQQLSRRQTLSDLRTQYQIQLSNLSREINEKAGQLSLNGIGLPGQISPVDVELSNLVKSQFEMSMSAAMAKSTYETVAGQLERGIDPAQISELLARNPEVMRYKQDLASYDQQLAGMARVGPDHPTLLRYQRQRDSVQQKLNQTEADIRAEERAKMVEGLRNQMALSQASLEEINKRVDTLKKEAANLNSTMATYLAKREEELSKRDLLKQVEEQLQMIDQAQNNQDSAPVVWANRPQDPDTPSFPKLPITMTLAVILGLALSLGIAFLREMMDTSVRSPRDIARVGQMNLLGIIPHENDDPQSAGARLPLVIFDAPHSMMAEQFRQIRSRLQHASSLDMTRSILVTGPSPNDGNSTIACNLAAGLALNGRRILLIDANFRRPELHKIFNLSNDRGFSSILASPDDFENVIQETPVPNLSVLTSGPRPANATELLDSQLLIDFLERALAEFDHVIFDSGPLLFVSESVALAPRVDGVITVVRARNNSRGLLQRMRDGLRQLKAEHLGVVLNAVRSQGGGYYGRNIKAHYAYQNDEA